MDFNIGLDFNEQGLLNSLERVYQAADRTNKKWEQLNGTVGKGQSGGGGGAGKQINDTIRSTNTATSSFLKLGAAAGVGFGAVNLIAGAFQTAGSAAYDFVKGNITIAASLEQVQTNFTTYLKSGEKAKALLGELGRFAADTPFTQADVFGNAEKLLGFGFAADEVTDTLQRLGDISGGSSDKLQGLVLALGQVRAKQKVQGEELLQFAERGVPIYEALAKAIGKSVPETQALVTKGVVGFGDLQKAISLLTEEGGQFNGVLKNQSQTFNGLVSTLQGDFEQLRGELGAKLLPYLKDLVRAADDFIKGINIEDAIAPFKLFRDEIARIIDQVKEFLQNTGYLNNGVEFLKTLLDGVGAIFNRLVIETSNLAIGILDLVEPIVRSLQPAVSAITDLLGGLIDKFAQSNDSARQTGDGFSTVGNAIAKVTEVIGKGVEVVVEFVSALIGLEGSARSSDPIIRGFGDAVQWSTGWLRDGVKWVYEFVLGIREYLGILETADQQTARLQGQAAAERDARRKQDLDGREEEYASRRDAANDEKKLLETQSAARKKAAADATKASAEAQKKADENFAKEQARAKARASLLKDETDQQVAEEQIRYEAQLRELKKLFAGKAELKGLLEQAEQRHFENVDKIQGDAFTKEQEILADRIKAEQEFNDSYLKEKERQITSQKNLEGINIQTAEATTQAYLKRLKAEGASAEEIQLLEEQFDLEFKRRRLSSEIAFNEALLTTIAAGDTERIAEVKASIALLQAELSNVQFDLDNPEPVKINKLQKALEGLKKRIADALGIKPEELGPIVDSAVGAFGDLFSSLNALQDAEIQRQDALIEKIKERVSEQEEAVAREKEQAELGKANNLKTEQERLDALLKQQDQYEKQAADLRDKAQKRALAAEIIAQVSNTVSAVAKIWNANAGIPIVGAIIAGAQIAAMFAAIAAARQKAKASAVERLYTGGEIPWGRTDEDGKRGYMIEGTNIMVGGGEFVTNRAVTKENREFLKRLNAGAYKGIDMVGLVEGRGEYLRRQASDMDMYTQTANRINAMPRRSHDYGPLIEVMEKHHNRMMRQGFAQLQKLGYRVLRPDGTEVHYSIDPMGNQHKTIEHGPK